MRAGGPVVHIRRDHFHDGPERRAQARAGLTFDWSFLSMSLLVTGSIGIDTVETPAGRRDNVIGGSAIYFSYAASFFHPVRLVGAVGEDAPKELFNVFQNQPVDTSGLEIRKGSKTFRWHGSYIENLNEAVSVQTDLNIL